MVTWRAGGPDIQFQGVQEFPNIPNSFQMQCSIGDKFQENFKPITCDCTLGVESGFTSTEPTGRIVDIMKRACVGEWRTRFTPTAILTRQYLIASGVITPAFAGLTFNFPQVMYAIPAIQKALSSFYYFRSDLKITLKLILTTIKRTL